ncbi:hypothetical protein PLICRDRAFT_174746 [Plicaturopsis crispa FD-325 SS-3]|nr:hypothetical protein PLICRDRAFT_174746 [Plicaturopsis crispa FD-325 SS-3]
MAFWIQPYFDLYGCPIPKSEVNSVDDILNIAREWESEYCDYNHEEMVKYANEILPDSEILKEKETMAEVRRQRNERKRQAAEASKPDAIPDGAVSRSN